MGITRAGHKPQGTVAVRMQRTYKYSGKQDGAGDMEEAAHGVC